MSATFQCPQQDSLPIAAPIGQYVMFVLTAGNVVAGGANADALGITNEAVTQEQLDAGKVGCAVTYFSGGRMPVKASAAISVGAAIGCAANGLARTAVTGDVVLAIATEAAAAANDVITVVGIKAGRIA